jgi:hypothetical protein
MLCAITALGSKYIMDGKSQSLTSRGVLLGTAFASLCWCNIDAVLAVGVELHPKLTH